MAETTKAMVDERIEILQEEIEKLEPGTEEYERVELAIADLLTLRAQIDKDRIMSEESNKVIKEERLSRIVRVVMSGVEVLVPLAVYSVLWHQGLAFEKDNYVSSASVKNLFQRFKFF